MRLILFVILGYLALVLVIFVTQRNMLYFPTRQLPAQPQLDRSDLKLWPPDLHDYQALMAMPDGPALGSILVFHGNAGAAVDRVYYLTPLLRAGYRVFLAEYPGYGGRAGSPSETSIVSDAIDLTGKVQETYPGPVYLWGESLGAAVAASVAAETDTIEGLVLITPWDALENVAARHYWYLPVRWLLQDRYDTVKQLQAFRRPVAVLVAEQDEIIPPAFAMALYDQIAAPKQLWQFAGAGHNSWPIHADARWWQEVLLFFNQQDLQQQRTLNAEPELFDTSSDPQGER